MVLEVAFKLDLTEVYRKCNESSQHWKLYDISLTEEGEKIASEIFENRLNSSSHKLREVLREYPQTLLMVLSRHMVNSNGWTYFEVPHQLDKIKKSGRWFYGEDKLYRYEVEMILENARYEMMSTNTLFDVEAYFWRSVSWHPMFRQYCETLMKKLRELRLAGYMELYNSRCSHVCDLYLLPAQLVSFINLYAENYNNPSREMMVEFLYIWLLTSSTKRLTREECINRLRTLDLTEIEFSEYLEDFHKKRLTSQYNMSAKINEQPLIIIDSNVLMQELSDRFKMIVSLLLTK